ncbi:MAG TPA: translation elongation factor Ts [Candidatus Obscuribacter sp.]|nr:elongation factor Ts [Candidatus Melainabacteria bacterium]MBK8221230.1 elongation factor Ts [Candidatus Obscuribacter sp.]MBK9279827.1 elongation factor Ts [Candidatus Obscuribacter sp.]MBL8082618.1 elongation factor Ts [Candidatus Obscuribacter sp.]HMW91549.1 translation elongation factor Ts [Candidatus Obscuribacter sp.]
MSTVVEVSASMVKELREKSGAAMMDCKKALVEAGGDFEKAFELLRQKGAAAAGKKASRITSEGLVVGQVSECGKVAALVEVNCETDFVARNDEFQALGKELAAVALKEKPTTVEELLAKQTSKGNTVKELVTEAVAKTGENINVKRLQVFESTDGITGLYIHALGGKMGAIVELSADKCVKGCTDMQGLAREIAMHVVSAKPSYLDREAVPADMIENERRIEAGKADLADKKPEMREKIVAGRVDKILAERCLTEQPFVKEQSTSVGKYLAAKGKELGVATKPVRFALFILGEGEGEAQGEEA